MMNSKVKNIIKHNVEISIRNKWFVILNILMLTVAIVSFNFANIKTVLKNNNIDIGNTAKVIIAIEDNTGLLREKLEEEIINEDLSERLEISEVTNESTGNNDDIKDNLIKVILNEDDVNLVSAKIISKEAVNANYLDTITAAITDVRDDIISENLNISNENIKLLKSEPDIERVMLNVDESSNSQVIQISRIVINYIVFFILIMVLSATANSIAQEKTSKSIEYVLTSISAKDYLLSKVLSTILVYVIQFVFAIVYMIIGIYISAIIKMAVMSGQGLELSRNSIASLSSFVDGKMLLYIFVTFIYLVLTIFILNVIQAVLSSKTTNITEAGNTTIILLMLNIVTYIVSNFLIVPLQVPSVFMYIISCIPVISMYFVPPMILLGEVSLIQVVIATIILVCSVPLSLKICAKYFKNGILNNNTLNKKEKKNNNLNEYEEKVKKIEGREYKKVGYVLGFSVILYIVTSLVLSLLTSFITVPVHNVFKNSLTENNVSVILTCITSCVSLITPYLFLRAYTDKEEREQKVEKASIGKSLLYVLMGIPVITFIQILTSIILKNINVDYNIIDKLNIFDSTSVLSTALFFIQIAVLPAIFEELYMRKGALNYAKKYDKVFAIITTSIMFAGIHLNLSQSIFAFMLGIVFAYIAVKTNRIFPTMLLHFINNGLSALILILNDNLLLITVVGLMYIILNFAGIIMIILTLVFKFSNKKNNKIKKEKSIALQMYKHIITDYTFVIALIVVIILSIYTEKMLTIM